MGANHPAQRRAVFLDRDGVINRNVLNPATGEWEAPLTAAQFVLLPGTLQALRQLQRDGFLLLLVSNQPNVAKGKSTLAGLRAIHAEFCRQLESANIFFGDFYYCLHHPEGIVPQYSRACTCRKPSPYFLLRASREFNLELSQCWMIGDRSSDVLCGRAAGTRTILIAEGGMHGADSAPDHIAPGLASAADIICGTALIPPGQTPSRFVEAGAGDCELAARGQQ